MARKRRLKLPNGFGSIKYLGKNRRNPYAVYPPVTEWTQNGPVSPLALGYKPTWEEAYELLTVYNMEKKGQIKTVSGTYIDRSPTFASVFEEFFKEKYETNQSKKFSKQSQQSTKAAFRNCSTLHNMQVAQIKYKDLQQVVNDCPLRHASLELIVSLFHQMYAYMIKYEIVDTDYSSHVYIPKEDDDESGEPFTEQELDILWQHKDNSIVRLLLIMCYSGYRITAYTKIEINKKEMYFKGGVKTKSGKDRIVPIHSCIQEFISVNGEKCNLLNVSANDFRKSMYTTLEELGIAYTSDGKKHTPHDCRHTFSALCEKYKVNENDRKRMMGHSFGSDITNAKYGHRTVEELREEIEKIKPPSSNSKELKICC